MLDEEQSEILTFGLTVAVQRQQQALNQIMQERLQRAADGEAHVSEWKMDRFNSLLYRVSRLNQLITAVANAPDAEPSPEAD